MQYMSLFPVIAVKDITPAKKKTPQAPWGKRKVMGPPLVHDWPAIIKARLTGASWQQLANDFGFPDKYRVRAQLLHTIALRELSSEAVAKLKLDKHD